MKILKILAACFAVLVLSAFFVFELIFSRSVDNSLFAYAEENITSDFVEPLSGDDPDPSIIDYHWDLSGFDQYNLNSAYDFNSGYYRLFINAYLAPDTVYSCKTDFSSDLPKIEVDSVILWNDDYFKNVNFFTFTSPSDISSGLISIICYVNNPNVSVSQVMLVKGTYTAETMPAYQPNLKYIFTTGFTNGYRDGYDTGYDSGRNYGYNLGYISGYDTGYSYGRNSQISEGLFKNPLDVFLQPISNFLNTDIFGSFSIGDGFTIAFFVMIALIFIKMFAGG